jgi:hypothetical protein
LIAGELIVGETIVGSTTDHTDSIKTADAELEA